MSFAFQCFYVKLDIPIETDEIFVVYDGSIGKYVTYCEPCYWKSMRASIQCNNCPTKINIEYGQWQKTRKFFRIVCYSCRKSQRYNPYIVFKQYSRLSELLHNIEL